MKKIILLLLLIFTTVSTFAQTEVLIADRYTNDGKKLYKLTQLKYFTFVQKSDERLEFKIEQSNSVLIDGYISKTFERLLEDTKSNIIVRNRIFIVYDKTDNVTSYKFLLTTIQRKGAVKPDSFTITVMKNNEVGKSYLGKVN